MLAEYSELNLTRLIGYCGLNMTKHKEILDDMEKKELITKTEESWGSKTIRKYKLSPKGLDFCREILLSIILYNDTVCYRSLLATKRYNYRVPM